MRLVLILLSCLFVLPSTAVGDGPSRTWTDATGQFSVEAELVVVDGDRVQLKKTGGELLSVPLARLSDADQAFLKDLPKLIEGEVVAISDGDTLTVLDDAKQQHKVRLEGIDAPEGHQAFGNQARKLLAAKVFRKRVRVEWKEKDRYGRILGHVHEGRAWVNQELVSHGLAWHYKKYSNDERLAEAELRARDIGLGLWSDANPIAPWDFRAGVKDAVSPRGSPTGEGSDTPPATTTTVYVTRTGQKYHLDGCRHLSKSKIPISLADAQSRYSPCKNCRPPQ